jgi:hypothetical protein
MRRLQTLLLIPLSMLALTAPSRAAVEVSFARGSYTDANIRGQPALSPIRRIFRELGARYLARGEMLRITVLDLDLAGFDLSTRGPSRLRVLNGATSPKIKFRYRLERGGRLIAAGEESLSDQSYLSRPGAALSSDELKYEREMLHDWFRQKFSAGRKPAR